MCVCLPRALDVYVQSYFFSVVVVVIWGRAWKQSEYKKGMALVRKGKGSTHFRFDAFLAFAVEGCNCMRGEIRFTTLHWEMGTN